MYLDGSAAPRASVRGAGRPGGGRARGRADGPGGHPAERTAENAFDILALLGDRSTLARQQAFRIEEACSAAELSGYRRLRRDAFVHEQGLFSGHDLDDRDADDRTVVLVAKDRDGAVVGGVRLGPVGDGPDIGWWQGGRLVVARRARGSYGIGAALVRAACARAEAEGILRFDATVQGRNRTLFERLGWRSVRGVTVAGVPHVLMRWPIGRIAAQAAAKSALGPLLAALRGPGLPGPGVPGPADGPPAGVARRASGRPVGEPGSGPAAGGAPYPGVWAALGGAGFVGDDGAPVPGTDLIAACDAIVPSMVERDPGWAGWCSVLVNVNDLAAMGASPVGLLDSVGAKDTAHADRILTGLARAARAYGVPVLGGHTQLGVPAALSVTALGRAGRPVPGGGGRPGHAVRLTADLGGGWREGYRGRQWDSSTRRRTDELRTMTGAVAAARPAAAKDVSMAGIAGTLGMLAEASGCGAVLDMASVPRPSDAAMGDWLSCFPGFAMLTTDEPGAAALPAGPATGAVCGELTTGQGVGLRWPDGEITDAVAGPVTGMGTA
ncbi:MSMEG_0567/sll0787 family protein [Streptomyces odonnellii]|uniref:MSMEG_0567/sll0787 family protein n=1 Tax=Streptomyces odonnellii TaxID=1417980 RepID=UPI000A503F03|nr:MSMEG_0567/sll0787 family protein [Streptomyces odonnellii]